MSDDFLTRMREEPRHEFAERLERRLSEIDSETRQGRTVQRRLVPALATGGCVALLAFAFTLEPVRATARGFLDLFRVKRFAAVPVDAQRMQRLAQAGLDLKTIVAGQVQVLVAPEEPVVVADLETGARDAGVRPALPRTLPAGTELVETRVGRSAAYRVVVDTEKLDALADAAGASEIEIPAAWNGLAFDIETPPVLALRYEQTVEFADGRAPRKQQFVLLQSAAPDFELPEGLDLATLGRLGLRVAGMSPEEAESFARSIDWRSTLLVPVPVQGGTFREVEVSGHKGLLVIVEPPKHEPSGRRPPTEAVLLWSNGEKVFALRGPAIHRGIDVIEFAQEIG